MRQSDSVSEELDTENVQCALDFENTMNELETQLYYRHLPPKEVALRVMEAACKFYDADWCGLIQVDLDLGLWKPLWWHNEFIHNRSYNLMIDKFSQVAENLPAADRDADRQYHVINGYPVVFSFSKEPNPEAFERIRNILLATSYTKKVG